MGVPFESRINKVRFRRIEGVTEGDLKISLGTEFGAVRRGHTYDVSLALLLSLFTVVMEKVLLSSIAAAEPAMDHMIGGIQPSRKPSAFTSAAELLHLMSARR